MPIPALRGFASPRFGKLARDSTIKGRVRGLLVLVHVECRELERKKYVAEVELSDGGNGLRLVTHAGDGSAGLRYRRDFAGLKPRVGRHDLDHNRRDVIDAAVIVRVGDHCVDDALRRSA